MKTIELNIGLGNNPFDVVDIIARITNNYDLEIIDSNVVKGQYKGESEDCLVVLARTPFDSDAINLSLILLADSLNQESIAYTLSGRGELVYRRGFEGERQEFNYNYFQTIQTFGKGTQTGAIRNTGASLNKLN